MNWFILRIIAMSTMLIDHIWWNFINNPILLTRIGRIAFPCYAFLLAEGFLFIFKDKERFTKHISTLILLAVGSELCYDMLEFGSNVAYYMESQNIMFTLLLWFLWMAATELLLASNKEKSGKVCTKNIIVLICTYLLIGFANYIMKGNYNLVGPWLIIAFYWYLKYSRKEDKTKNEWSWIKRFWVLLVIFMIYLPIYFWVRSGFADGATWFSQVKSYLPWVAGHFLAALILSFSNWKLWYHKKWFKYLYTLFYPIHAFIIGFIIILLGN